MRGKTSEIILLQQLTLPFSVDQRLQGVMGYKSVCKGN